MTDSKLPAAPLQDLLETVRETAFRDLDGAKPKVVLKAALATEARLLEMLKVTAGAYAAACSLTKTVQRMAEMTRDEYEDAAEENSPDEFKRRTRDAGSADLEWHLQCLVDARKQLRRLIEG